MDKRTIYSKTGKGSLEISKKSIKLASDERQTLILVDGKSNAGEIEEKLSRVQPMRLRVIFDKLVELDLIREFVTKQGPDSLMPIPGNTAMAMQVQELDEGELDFTALAPTASANTVKEVEERRQAAQRAEEEAGRARAEVERQAAAAAARQAQEDALRRQADEAAARARADDEARLRAEADAKARIEEEARRKVEEENRREAQRRADEEAQRKLAEDAKRKAAEEAERRARDDARRKAEEEEARRRAEEEARQRAEAEARRQAEEAARRRAEEEARRKAEEEARQAEEAARRRAAEEAAARQRAEEQRQRDEAERREREEAARRAAEDERRAAEERVRLLQEAEAREREDLERRQREEAEALLREQTERRAREEQEARERGRREEEAKRAAIAEEQRRRAAAVENAATAESRAADEAERRLAEEAARYTAALTPEIEAASAPASVDLDFAPAAGPKPGSSIPGGGGPDTFADTSGASSIMEAGLDDDLRAKKDIEKESRKELEQEAKENAKAAAKAKKDAEREAKRLAKESKVTVRRGGGIGFSLGKIIGIFVVLALAGGIGYLYFMPVDKALIEAAASARFGEPVRVGSAKFEPFPPQLKLSNVSIGDLNMPLVVAVPDPGSLAADKKIWKSIDINGITLDVAQARKFANLLLHDANRGTMVIQRIHVDKVSLTGTALPVPVFNANILLSASGEVKQAAFTLPDGKAQVQLVPDDKGWQGEFESRGILWPVGPKVAWESVRAKGVLTEGGIKFESIAITHFAGTAASAGELTWGRAWKYAGNLDVSGMETDLISTAFFGASQVSGTMDSKLTATLAAPTLAQLFDAPQLEGDVNVNKAMVKSLDLARTAQTGTQTSGPTRFTEYFTCSIASSGGRLTVKNVRGSSGLLSVTGEVGVGIEKSLSGVLNVEIGVSSNRTKAALKVSGTPADPKLTP